MGGGEVSSRQSLGQKELLMKVLTPGKRYFRRVMGRERCRKSTQKGKTGNEKGVQTPFLKLSKNVI